MLAGPLGDVVRAAEGLTLVVIDDKTGQPAACRMHLVGPGKKPRRADPMPFWSDHFVFPGQITLKLPVGKYTFQLERGPEYKRYDGRFVIEHDAEDAKRITLHRCADLAAEGWYSGDLYVRRGVQDAKLLMLADDLHVAQFVAWWNEKSEWGQRKPPARPLTCFDNNRCYSVMAGGVHRAGTELLYFNLPAPLRLNQTSAEYPPEIRRVEKARETVDAWVDLTAPYWWDLPMLVALGQVDSIEVLNSHFCRQSLAANEGDGRPRNGDRYQGPRGNAIWSQDIYFRLLDCGLRIPPSAGSGSGVAPNPVGYNRVYVHVDGDFSWQAWWKNLRAGRAFVTNGPLLRRTSRANRPAASFTPTATRSSNWKSA